MKYKNLKSSVLRLFRYTLLKHTTGKPLVADKARCILVSLSDV